MRELLKISDQFYGMDSYEQLAQKLKEAEALMPTSEEPSNQSFNVQLMVAEASAQIKKQQEERKLE